MDSDTDQDEDEIQPSFSMTISERGSHCHVVRKVCSDSRKGSAGMSSSSGSVEESAVEGNEVFFVEDSTYGVGLSDSASLTNNEESSLRVITVCCRPQKPYKSSADDRTSCAEKAADDIFDSIPKVNENEGEIRDEDSTHMQDTPEQTSTLDDRDPELDVPEETPPISAAVPISLESPSQEVLLARHEEGEFEDISALESKSNEFSTFESRGGVSESPDSTKSRNTQNESDIHVDSYETIEMLAQSIIFQSTCVVPVGSVQAVADPNLSEGMTLNDQGSSSTGQLPGRKRKHSGKKTADAEGAVGGSSAENSVSSGDAEESFENKDSDKEAKKKKNRCAVCRKKVGLTGFECRCGGLFCAVHRYSDKHDCTFDYREMGAQEIRRNNPVVVGEKIQKI